MGVTRLKDPERPPDTVGWVGGLVMAGGIISALLGPAPLWMSGLVFLLGAAAMWWHLRDTREIRHRRKAERAELRKMEKNAGVPKDTIRDDIIFCRNWQYHADRLLRKSAEERPQAMYDFFVKEYKRQADL